MGITDLCMRAHGDPHLKKGNCNCRKKNFEMEIKVSYS